MMMGNENAKGVIMLRSVNALGSASKERHRHIDADNSEVFGLDTGDSDC